MFNTSETLKDLEIPEGRRLLHDFYHDRRVKNTLEFGTVLDCWRLCRRGTEIQFSDGRRVRFETSLGVKLGTRVFFEEIVGRYYYNYVSGLVYGGAVLVLISLVVYLAGYVDETFALVAFSIQALLLLLLAFVTAYSPNEDAAGSNAFGASETLLSSMNSTVREMTNAVSDLFRLISQSDIRQDVLLTRLTDHLSKVNSENIRQYSDTMQETNLLLRGFLETTSGRSDALMQQNIEALREARESLESIARRLSALEAGRA
ncbi:MAG: hypothetical protein HY962_11660 [Ignavibacteriae bacterium]|nr:hypothetical protein [Ignavibacteriota bacterium]